ncbi:MAG: hypothetical protein AB7V06_12350 [Candidatus Obscuribacterales bacterium]
MRARRKRRNRKAYALIAVLSIGAFASLFLLGLATMTDSLLRSESVQKEKEFLLQAAECGLDYAVQDLNMGALGVTATSVDPPDGLTEQTTIVPAGYLPTPSTNLEVRVKVRKLNDTIVNKMQAMSYLYTPQMDNRYGPSYSATYNSPQRSIFDESLWRIVEVTAERGALSTSLRAYLSWQLDYNASNTSISKPYFSAPVVANDVLAFNDTSEGDPAGVQIVESDYSGPFVATDQVNGNSFKLNLVSNSEARLGKNAMIWGDVTVTNPSSGAPSSVVNSDSGASSLLLGRLTSNSGVDLNSGSNPTGTVYATDGEIPNLSTTPTDNVLAAADIFNGTLRQGVNQTPVQAPLATPNSQNVSAPVSYPAEAAPLPSYSSTSSIDLPAGTYKTSSLDSTGSSNPINITDKSQIYVSDSVDTSSEINVDSNRLVNTTGDARNMQIFYNGSKDLNIKLDTTAFDGLIYAPNAKVAITGTGNFVGAIVGKKVFINNVGEVRFLNDIGNDPAAPRYSQDPATVDLAANPGFQPYKVVTWQQVQKRLVASP